MDPVSQQQIIDAFRGATKSEVKRVTFPQDFDDIDFAKLEFLGWRDRKIPRRAYVSVPAEVGLVSILLT
ncbi:hypothetical protein MTP03_03580 [Tsukamurella sp. PLM1]|nr:hypothetical protein MTP03_03580 [Tsukamurella sp. PLM1]